MNKILFGILLITTFFVPSDASADGVLESSDVTKKVYCSSESKGQQCDRVASFKFCGLDKVKYKLKVATPENHCSDVSYAITVNGHDFGESGWLGKAQHNVINDIGYPSAGAYDIKVRATGRVGGCNNGRLSAWKAILSIYP